MAKNGRRPSSRGIVPNNKKQDKKVTSAFDTKINIPPGQEAVFNVQDNTAYLKQREKRASQIMGETGASYDEAIRQYTEEKNAAEAGTPMAIAERAKAIADAKAQLEAQTLQEAPQFTSNQRIAAGVRTEPFPLTPYQEAKIQQRTGTTAAGVSAVQAAIPTVGGAIVGSVAPVAGNILGASAAFATYKLLQHSKTNDASTRASTAMTNIGTLIKGLNAGTIDPYDGLQMWNTELMQLQRAEAELKALSANDVSEFLSDSGDDMERIDAFKRSIPMLAGRVQAAILKPDPRLAGELPPELSSLQNG